MPVTATGSATSFITFSRASTATRINASGVLESVASGVARLDYDPVTLAPRGLLVEEQRTNLFTYSEQFDNAVWVKTRASVTANAVTSPDGTVDAEKVVEDTSASTTHHVSNGATLASGVAYTASFYLKAAERTWAYISLASTAFGTAAGAYFNLSTGVIGTVSSGVTASILPAGNGWYRCIVTRTTVASGTGQAFVNLSTGDTVTLYTGDGTSGLYIWGAQLEAGSFATSYIPTLAASATRSADTASVATSSFPYSDTEGTIVVNATPSVVTASSYTAYSLSDGTSSNRFQSTYSLAQYHLLVSSGGVQQANINAGTPVAGAANKVAGVYKLNDFAASMNGAAAVADTSGTLPVSVSTLFIGSRNAIAEFFNGHIRQITYIPRRLTNAELVTRST